MESSRYLAKDYELKIGPTAENIFSNQNLIPEIYPVFLAVLLGLILVSAVGIAILEWRASGAWLSATLWMIISFALPFIGPVIWMILNHFKKRKNLSRTTVDSA